jgi:hypothetical protein
MLELLTFEGIEELTDNRLGSPRRTQNFPRTFDELDRIDGESRKTFDALWGFEADEAWDELNSPTNRRSIRHPSSNPLQPRGSPPKVKHAEISTLSRAAIAYAQLVFHHFVGYFNPRGPLYPPLRPGCAGLALVHTATTPTGGWNQYDIEYRVFDNTLRNVCWWGRIGNTRPPPRGRPAGNHYESQVRNALFQVNRQTFQARASSQGPDLIALLSHRPQVGVCACR